MLKSISIAGLTIAFFAEAAHAEKSLTKGYKDCSGISTGKTKVEFHNSGKLRDSKLIVEVKNGRWFNLIRKKGRSTKSKIGKANKWVEVNTHALGKGSLYREFLVQSQAFPKSADLWDRLPDDANRKYVSERNWSVRCTYKWSADQKREERGGGGKSEQTLEDFTCSDTRESPHTYFGEGWFDVPSKDSGALCNVIQEQSGKILRVRLKFDPRM